MMDDADHLNSLALGLSGILPSNPTQTPLPPFISRQGPIGPISPLLIHLKQLVNTILTTCEHPTASLEPLVSKAQSTIFALTTVDGKTAILRADDEAVLWKLTSSCWSASLKVCKDPSLSHHAEFLHTLGSDIFQLIESDSQADKDVAQYVQALCTAANEWGRLGRHDHAQALVSRAIKYAAFLESVISSDDVVCSVKEKTVVQLFGLYIQAATAHWQQGQQSVANNMLAKARQLSKHHSVTAPLSIATMAYSIAELQLKQTTEMDGNNDPPFLILTLLNSAKQHIDAVVGAGLSPCATDDAAAALLLKAENCKIEVYQELHHYHMRNNDALKAAQYLEEVLPALSFTSVHLEYVQGLLAAGNMVPKAVEVLEKYVHVLQDDEDSHFCWRRSFCSVAQAAVVLNDDKECQQVRVRIIEVVVQYFRAMHESQHHITLFLRCLLVGVDGDTATCDAAGPPQSTFLTGITLNILAMDDVVGIIFSNNVIQSMCYSMLCSLGIEQFYSCNTTAAALFIAAYQYAPPNERVHAALGVSCAYLRAGNEQQALQYLDIASGGRTALESPVCSLAEIVRLYATALPSSNSSAARVQTQQQPRHADIECILKLLPTLPDCHPAVVDAAAQVISRIVSQPSNLSLEMCLSIAKEAVKALIPGDREKSRLGPGHEAALLKTWIACLLQSLVTSTEGDLHKKYVKKLVSALKMATKRLKTCGRTHFAGKGEKAAMALGHLTHLGYRAVTEAYKYQRYTECVTLASSTCVLIDELQPDEGTQLQARLLCLAVYSLLKLPNSDSSLPSSRISLASKLLKKSKSLLEKGDDTEETQNLQTSCTLLEFLLAATFYSDVNGALGVLQTLNTTSVSLQCANNLVHVATTVLQSTSGNTDTLQTAIHRLFMDMLGNTRNYISLIPAIPAIVQLFENNANWKLHLQTCKATAIAVATASDNNHQEPIDVRRWLCVYVYNQAVKVWIDQGSDGVALAKAYLEIAKNLKSLASEAQGDMLVSMLEKLEIDFPDAQELVITDTSRECETPHAVQDTNRSPHKVEGINCRAEDKEEEMVVDDDRDMIIETEKRAEVSKQSTPAPMECVHNSPSKLLMEEKPSPSVRMTEKEEHSPRQTSPLPLPSKAPSPLPTIQPPEAVKRNFTNSKQGWFAAMQSARAKARSTMATKKPIFPPHPASTQQEQSSRAQVPLANDTVDALSIDSLG